jgi:ubiquinone/menaquinone biosynthesis C-methylase UbiE
MSWLKKKLWDWPDGLVWKATQKSTIQSRQNKYDLFLSLVNPQPHETILDVGVSPFFGRGTNFLEMWYPHPEKITALANDNPKKFNEFQEKLPQVKLVFGDGRKLPFPDNHFDIVFSNAVVEHVGPRSNQERFIRELLRVGKRCFITSPNAGFPIDSHTLLPFVHWLPSKMRPTVYRTFGRGYWADINNLNLLTKKDFSNLFPANSEVKLIPQKSFGLPLSWIAVTKHH